MKVQILVILRGGIWKEPEGRSKYQTELTRLRLCRRTKELKWSKVVELVESRRGGGMVGVEFQELFLWEPQDISQYCAERLDRRIGN